jgi:hypothetical protein
VIVKHLPLTSALSRAINDEAADWSLESHLLALIADQLGVANWQRQGKKGAPRPKRVPRPGQKQTQKIGRDPLPVNDLETWLAAKESEATK